MFKRSIYFFAYLITVLSAKAQNNLVPNPSFEDTVSGLCSAQMGINSVKYWGTNHVSSSPDYYNICSNSIVYPFISTIPYNYRCYQTPRSGDAFLGIYAYGTPNQNDSASFDTEYISTKLKAPLKANTCYYGECFINLANYSKISINQVSLLFTQNTFTTTPHSFTNTIHPQIQWDTTQYFMDTLNWVKISGTFIANGGEQYLTIGVFRDGTHLKKTAINSNFVPAFGPLGPNFLSYILIDDVSLYVDYLDCLMRSI